MKKTLLWMLIVLIVVGLLTGCSLESEDCNHDWSEWSEATAPTCKENGTEARSCTKCGEPETRTVLSLGHSFNTQNICTECGEELVFTKGLEYGEITVGDKTLYAVIGIGAAKETDIVIPVAHAGNSVLAVAPSAFKGNDLITSVYIPDGIEYIGANAFEYCVSLKSVNIGKTTSYIGTKAFDNCSGLESIYVSGDQLKIDENAFSNGNKLTTITLTGDIREIAQHAFNNTAYYDNPINWVSGALYIGEYLIDTNVELIPPSFIVKEGTKLIATSAFSNNDALVSITLPQGLKYINSRAFYGCASLAAISAPETLIAIDYGAFTDCLSLAEFYSTKYIELGNDVFLRSGLKRVTINVGWYLHSSYSSILDNLPKSSIEELNIYGVIRTNDNYSFTPFSRLKLLAFYDSISLATGTLSGLSNLEKMTIPTISLSEHFGYLFGAKEYENSTLVYGYYIPNSLKDITLLVERDRNLKVDETDMYLVSKGPLFKGWTLDRLTLQVDPDDKTEYAVNTTILGYAKIGTLTYGSQINYWSNFNESKAAYPSNVDTINYLGTFEEWCGEDAQQVVSVTKNSSKLFIKGVRIKELIIPDGVTDIEKYYSHISVEKLVIPGSVKTIGRHSYIRATDLKTLIIEDGVKTVGEGAFLGCTSLVNLTLGNITTIDQYAFSGCESLKNVTVPGTIESIGYAAFNDGGLTNIAFESGVTHISFQAFSNCTSLQNVSLPNTLLEIGTYAFKGCTGLNSIALPDSIENVGSAAFSGSGITFTEYENAYYVGNENNPYLVLVEAKESTVKSCLINSNTKVIARSAFYNCRELESITIPDKVITVGSYAFSDCVNLSNVSIGTGVLNLGDYAFDGCTNLIYNKYDNAYYLGSDSNPYTLLVKATSNDITGCEIHSETKFINGDAFMDCTNLASVEMFDNVRSVGGRAFYGCSSLESVSFGDNNQLSSIGAQAYYGCSSLKNVSFGDNNRLTSIGNSAFYGCSSLLSITLGNNNVLSFIGDVAFSGCTNLVRVEIPRSVTSIGERAFYGCSSLESVTLYNNTRLTSIGNGTFDGCSSLISIVIPDEVSSIGQYSFSGCESLLSITLPKGLVSVDDLAFQSCLKLVEVINKSNLDIKAGSSDYEYVAYYAKEVHNGESKVVNYNDYLFYTYDGVNYLLGYVGNDTKLVLPDSYNNESYEIYKCAFYKCSSLTSVAIPDSVTSIGDYAFKYCFGLTSVVIGTNVTSIADSPFDDCFKLVEVINKSNLDIKAGSSDYGHVAYYAKEVHNGESKVVNYNDYLFYTYDGVNYLLGYVGNDTKLVLPDSYNNESYEIYKYAFWGCSSLTSITIPDSVTSIGYAAFCACSNLESVNFGENSQLTSIGPSTFTGCSNLTSIIIPDSVTSIGSSTFARCSNLTSIIIPDSVTSIGNSAFYGCDNLTIYCEALSQPNDWGNNWNYSNCPVEWGYKEES